MDFAPSPRAAALREKVAAFLHGEIEPIESAYHRDLAEARRQGTQWTPLPVIEELKSKARALGLWNLFLPKEHAGDYAAKYGTDGGEGLSNVDYAPLAELMGRSAIAPLVFNCNAPDTGNMEVLLRYGTQEQRDTWLDPLLDGRIRSASGSVRPMKTNTRQSGWPTPVDHHLRPFTTTSSPSTFTVAVMLVASELATPGSVMVNADRIRPSSSGSSQVSRCSWVP